MSSRTTRGKPESPGLRIRLARARRSYTTGSSPTRPATRHSRVTLWPVCSRSERLRPRPHRWQCSLVPQPPGPSAARRQPAASPNRRPISDTEPGRSSPRRDAFSWRTSRWGLRTAAGTGSSSTRRISVGCAASDSCWRPRSSTPERRLGGRYGSTCGSTAPVTGSGRPSAFMPSLLGSPRGRRAAPRGRGGRAHEREGVRRQREAPRGASRGTSCPPVVSS